MEDKEEEMNKLDHDIVRDKIIMTKVARQDYAVKLYGTLCNMRWQKDGSRKLWSVSWRSAGGIVAGLRDNNENYLDFYCSGVEDEQDPEVLKDLKKIGWNPIPWEKR
tara:strand:- start:10029 stop:10349 length:321 start_codon:yes stop_codon:yes gene_type:complete